MAKSGVKSKKSKLSEGMSETVEVPGYELANLELQVEQLQASHQKHMEVYGFLEDNGWSVLGSGANSRGPELEKLRNWSQVNRRMAALHPLIKKGIGVRIAYLGGEGVVLGEPGVTLVPRAKAFIEDNEEFLFSEEAFASMELALNTDGQYFYLLSKGSGNQRLVTRVPLAEISDVAMETGNTEKALFIKRTWVVTKKNGDKADAVSDLTGGGQGTEEVSKWYPMIDLPAKTARSLKKINGVDVDSNSVMLRASANKQSGWTWGVADIQASRGMGEYYKEFIDSQFVLMKSLAQFTWKTSTATAKGTRTAATKMAATPTKGPDGKILSVGQAYNGMAGGDIAAINKAGANINFESGRALAELAIAGLGLAIHHVLPEKGEASDETLDIPTLKTMVTRQKLHKRTFEKIFKYFNLDVKVDFPPIQAEPIHRVIQAIVAALGTNLLFPEEGRQLVLSALNPLSLEPKAGLPKPSQWVKFVGALPTVNANPGTTPIPNKDPSDPKKRSPAGATSDGDHEMRPSEAYTKELVSLISEAVLAAIAQK